MHSIDLFEIDDRRFERDRNGTSQYHLGLLHVEGHTSQVRIRNETIGDTRR